MQQRSRALILLIPFFCLGASAVHGNQIPCNEAYQLTIPLPASGPAGFHYILRNQTSQPVGAIHWFYDEAGKMVGAAEPPSLGPGQSVLYSPSTLHTLPALPPDYHGAVLICANGLLQPVSAAYLPLVSVSTTP